MPASPLLQPSRFGQSFTALLPRETSKTFWHLTPIPPFQPETHQCHFWPELPLLARNELLSPRNWVGTSHSLPSLSCAEMFLPNSLACSSSSILCSFYRTKPVTSFSVSPRINKTPLPMSYALCCCPVPAFLHLPVSQPDAAAKQFVMSKFCLLCFRTALSFNQLLFNKCFAI